MKWQAWFLWIFLFSCVDGFISNWLYPAKLPLLYRDIFILGVYILFLTQESASFWIAGLRQAVGSVVWLFAACFMWVGIWQMFNPHLPHFLLGLLGFKILFFYWPLAVLAYAYAESPETARRWMKTVVIFSIPISLFGLYQFSAGPAFLVTTFGPGFERATIVAALYETYLPKDTFLRVIGTFASTSQFSVFLVINSMLTFALLLTSSSGPERIRWIAVQLLNFLAMLTTGSRGGLLILGLAFLMMGRFCIGIGRLIRFGLLAAAGMYLAFHWLGGGVVKRFETLKRFDILTHRTVETTPLMFAKILKEAPLGKGLGMGSSAARHLVDERGGEEFIVENHLSKMQLETGVVGTVFFYLLVAALIRRWMTRWKPLEKYLLALTGPLSSYCVTLCALSFIIGGFDSPPGAIFFWALVGMVARLAGSANYEIPHAR